MTYAVSRCVRATAFALLMGICGMTSAVADENQGPQVQSFVEGADALDDYVGRVLDGDVAKPAHPAYVAFAYKRRGHLLESSGPSISVSVTASQAAVLVSQMGADQLKALSARALKALGAGQPEADRPGG